jgi:hypothetical protein
MPVPALLGLLFCSGIVASLAGGAVGSLTRATVPAEAYVPGRSLMKIASQTAQIAGNPVGGALVVALGTSGAILVDAGANAVASTLVLALVADRANAGERGATSLVRDSLAGARDILADHEVARLMVFGWLVPLFSVAPEAVAAPYVADRHGSASLVGWWLAALPAGVIAGDILAVRFLRPDRQRRLTAPVAAAGFVPYLAFVFQPSIPLAVVLLAVSGLGGMYSLGLDARLREATPERTFARMMALSQAGLMTLQGLGFALAGALAEAVGAGGSIVLAGGCGVVVVAALRLGAGGGTSEAVHNLST